jgi:hypothetical protein
MYAGAGREKLARYAFGIADKVTDVTILERTVDGQLRVVVRQAGAPVRVLASTVTAGRIIRIWAVRNPEKLRSWSDLLFTKLRWRSWLTRTQRWTASPRS